MTFPSWRYGPNDQAEVFQNEDDVPEGWADHPSRVRSPLDHDGRPGGSLKGEASTASKGRRKRAK